MNSVLSLRELRVAFGGVAALSSVSFELEAEQIVAVIGPNGAGKSTLLNAICASAPRTAGEIRLQNVALPSTPMGVARRRVTRSFQHPHLLLSESVRDNLMLGGYLRHRHPLAERLGLARPPEDDGRERMESIADEFGLLPLLDTACQHLPYGLQKVVDIARAFVGDPVLILLDEPSSGLDSRETERLGRMIRDAVDRRKATLLLVEHDMQLVRTLADRVVALEAGTVAMNGTAEEVLDSLELAQKMMRVSVET